MDFHDRQSFVNQVRGALLGLDVGSKTYGLAVSDRLWRVASPLKTLKRIVWKKDKPLLLEVIKNHKIMGLVFGWPRLMNGDESDRCTSTRHIAENMYTAFQLPCLFWDERLSTVASLGVLEKEADLSRQKRAQVIDHTAAAWMLQGALDNLRRLRASGDS